jgi:ubiquinone/menaquinone biosynthesis C-methylase UbiE
MTSNESFFDNISDFYDKMTGYDNALKSRMGLYKKFITAEMKTAADLGCGTGLDSIALSLNGLTVTGFDISVGMIGKAKEKSAELKLNIEFHNYSIADIPETFSNMYSFAVSMGNTLANLDKKGIRQAIINCYRMLQPGGKFLLQILNYEKILNAKERIVNITHKDGKYYVRFYDFLSDEIDFNILSFDENELKNKQLNTTKLYPYNCNDLSAILTETGFTGIEYFGSLSKEKFDNEKSKDIIILACR